MKAVILAGGGGTRLAEETDTKPKPMVEIGGRPIIWHIMKMYSHYGLRDFVICLGYKGYVIKEYFLNYLSHFSDITVDFTTDSVRYHRRPDEAWRVTMVDTGEKTQTGGRIKRIAEHINGDDCFCMTYGDAVTDLAIGDTIRMHRAHGLLATVTAVRPMGRFGTLDLDGQRVNRFEEKPVGDGGGWINGGFFVLSPGVLDFIENDDTIWEHEPMQQLTQRSQLAAYQHHGFWHCMDTLRDKRSLEGLWAGACPPWKSWTDE